MRTDTPFGTLQWEGTLTETTMVRVDNKPKVALTTLIAMTNGEILPYLPATKTSKEEGPQLEP